MILHLFKMKEFASCILASDVKDILTLVWRVENNVIYVAIV